MRFFERPHRAERAPVGCTYPMDRSHGQRSQHLAIVGHG
jgi:hypothetical protein